MIDTPQLIRLGTDRIGVDTVTLNHDLNTLKQTLAQSLTGNTSTSVLSASWFFDSGCYNHMVVDNRLFKRTNSVSYPHVIYTFDNSCYSYY